MRLAASTFLASALLVSSLASAAEPATLHFVSPESELVGNTFGMDAIDARALVLDERDSTPLEAGMRTVWYSCPGETAAAGASRMSFAFEAGKRYELVCRAGREATIVEADGC